MNLLHTINKDYCLDLSGGANKCFAAYVSPEPGGRTKDLSLSFVDSIYNAIINSGTISVCLATQRLEAISNLEPNINLDFLEEDELVEKLNDIKWYEEKKI